MQREWRTLERGRVGKIGVGENRGRWVLAALWRAPGVAPRRFGASNAETLRWCWLHIPTHFNPSDVAPSHDIHVHVTTWPQWQFGILFLTCTGAFFYLSLGPSLSPSPLPSLSFFSLPTFTASYCTFASVERLVVRSERNTKDRDGINSGFYNPEGQLRRQGPRWTAGCGSCAKFLHDQFLDSLLSRANLVFIELARVRYFSEIWIWQGNATHRINFTRTSEKLGFRNR